jgi:hypothetical protein
MKLKKIGTVNDKNQIAGDNQKPVKSLADRHHWHR